MNVVIFLLTLAEQLVAVLVVIFSAMRFDNSLTSALVGVSAEPRRRRPWGSDARRWDDVPGSREAASRRSP